VGPHVTERGLGQGLPSYQWHLDPSSCLATTDMAETLEGAAPLGVELGPYLTQCCPGRGLPSLQSFGHNTPTLQTGQDRTERQTDNGPIV